MALVVGLDIGTGTLTGAVFSGSAKKLQLLDFFVESIPSVSSGGPAPGESHDDPDEAELGAPLGIEQILERTLRERNLKGADVICAIDTKDCVTREFLVPFSREDQIRRTIIFEAEGHFPGVDLDEAVLEYLKVGEVQGKSRLLAWALRDDVISARLDLLKQAAVDPVSLDLDAAALFSAFTLTPTFDPQRTTLLVDMGVTSTKILLVDEGELRKVRALRLEAAVTHAERLIPEPASVGAGSGNGSGGAGRDGGADGADYSIEARFQEIEDALRRLDPISASDDDLSDSLDVADEPIAVLSDEELDRLGRHEEEAPAETAAGGSAPAEDSESRNHGDDGNGTRNRFPGQSVGAEGFDYGDFLERVGIEIQRSLAASQLSSPVELICLTGGMSAREEAKRYFAEEFDVETIQLDFGASGESFDSDLTAERQAELGRVGAVAVGLAAKGLGHDPVGLDFRKGRFRYEHRFERLLFPLLVSTLLVFLIFLQFTFWAFRDFKREKLRLQGYQEHSREVYETFFEDKLPAGTNARAVAASKIKAWATAGKGSQSSRYLNATEALNDFAEAMNEVNKAGVHFTVENMDFYFEARRVQSGARRKVEPKVQLSKIKLSASESRDKFIRIINSKSRYFTVEKSTSDRNTRDESFTVTLNLEVKPERLRDLFK